MRIFAGTYTEGNNSRGIYTLEFDPNTPGFRVISSAFGRNPSFLAKHGRSVYAVNELPDTGRLEHFVVENDGSLKVSESVDFPGSVSCHLAVHPSGVSLYAANYGSGNIAGFSLLPDGNIGNRISLINHEGSGPNKGRQSGPHAHSVNLSPNGNHLVAADLGTDKLMVYDIDSSDGSLAANRINPSVAVTPGEGPRHLVFHPIKGKLYLVTELLNNLVVFDYDSESGALAKCANFSVLPKAFTGVSTAADIHLSPDNRFLYASSRGWNGLATFALDDEGDVTSGEFYEGFGETPRNFALSPDGAYVFIAYQGSNVVVAVLRDKITGGLKEIAAEISIPAPVCILLDDL